MIFDLVVAPTFVALSSPSLKSNIVGIPLIPYFVGVFGSLSILCFAIVTSSDISSEISSNTGPICLQGPNFFDELNPLTQRLGD